MALAAHCGAHSAATPPARRPVSPSNLASVSSWSIDEQGGQRFILTGMWEAPQPIAAASTRSRAIFTAAASGNHSFFLVADDVGTLTGTTINAVSGLDRAANPPLPASQRPASQVPAFWVHAAHSHLPGLRPSPARGPPAARPRRRPASR
jgi:hypothetical protein